MDTLSMHNAYLWSCVDRNVGANVIAILALPKPTTIAFGPSRHGHWHLHHARAG